MVSTPQMIQSTTPKFLSPTNGARLDRAQSPRPPSAVSDGVPSLSSPQPQPAPQTAPSTTARSMEEVSFQFDRHVQEIRRRRTLLKKTPLPDRDDFTHIEAESGKRILDVRLYIQALVMYFIESLARDDRVRKIEPLHWSRMKALLSRLYDSSSPAQSIGIYVEKIMYWKNPPETLFWFILYFTLWFYGLWLPGLISILAIRILNNRFGFIGGAKRVLNIPDPLALAQAQKESEQGRKSMKMHSQLRELIHSKDLTDWISQMTKIWGPYCQALLEENICYLERLKNLFRWVRPHQTWRVLGLLSFYIFVSTFMPYMVVPAIGLFIGTEFFVLLPLQKYYPRFSHVFSPVELVLWGVPTTAELAVEMLTQQEMNRRKSEEGEGSSSIANLMQPATTSDVADSVHESSASFVSGLSPASKIKYEYQKRTRGRSSSNASGLSESMSMDDLHDKSEFHCLLRGKPGKLVVTEEALLFRSAKLLGREIEAEIPWEMIDTIKKSKSMSIGLWSIPGIEVTDIHDRVFAFQNVVKRDDAFRKLAHSSSPELTASTSAPTFEYTANQRERFTRLLENDVRVKVAGVDLDGILRGKVMARTKFLSILESGFGFCSVIFGWDMHDKTYAEELSVSNAANGYGDIIAIPDLTTYRRIPWENNIPFFLLSFYDPSTREPLAVCPRGVLKTMTDKLATFGWEAMCGVEFEFFNFRETPDTLAVKGHTAPQALTPGMFGYSLLRPSLHQDYFYDIFDQCKEFGINIESLHTETGPGVYEAALSYDTATHMADMANLFKLSVKQLGIQRGIMPTFMAKPYGDQPGCSGHIHFSLRDIATKANIFAAATGVAASAAAEQEQERQEQNDDWESVKGVESMSQVMKWFVAGLLTGLPSIMAILAPNINSYMRLVENYWAPITVSWGIESRVSAIRVIGPPQCDPKGTRIEMRVGGADINPHLAIAACLATGVYGIENKLPMPVGPTMTTTTTTTTTTTSVDLKIEGAGRNERLPKSLKDAAQIMLARGSLARQVLGDEFVDHYGATRMNECRLWETAVTTWETKRYFELV
ncbi:hypothetical protein BG004_007340 [Podila humilis]|nr:hypothetical protein BG004_007340 [Podila humilis]